MEDNHFFRQLKHEHIPIVMKVGHENLTIIKYVNILKINNLYIFAELPTKKVFKNHCFLHQPFEFQTTPEKTTFTLTLFAASFQLVTCVGPHLIF